MWKQMAFERAVCETKQAARLTQPQLAYNTSIFYRYYVLLYFVPRTVSMSIYVHYVFKK